MSLTRPVVAVAVLVVATAALSPVGDATPGSAAGGSAADPLAPDSPAGSQVEQAGRPSPMPGFETVVDRDRTPERASTVGTGPRDDQESGSRSPRSEPGSLQAPSSRSPRHRPGATTGRQNRRMGATGPPAEDSDPGISRDGSQNPAAGTGATVSGSGSGPETNETVDNGSVPTVVQTVTYRRTPERRGTIRAEYNYTIGPNASTVVVYDYEGAVVVGADGFVGGTNGRWRWNGHTETPSLTMRLSVNESSPTFGGLGLVDTGEWTLAHPRTGFAVRTRSRPGWVYSWEQTDVVDERVRVTGPGYAGGSLVFLGEAERASETAAGQRFTVVKPANVTGPATGAVLETVVRAARQLRVGARDDRVNVFVGPKPLRGGGLTAGGGAGGQDFWVTANASVDPPSNLWVHEYVHTRQNATLGPEMRWFREASASYYAGLLSVRQGLGGRPGFDRFLARLHDNRSANATLANRSTWESALAPYRKGERVLAALDARIRAATDRNQTLQDVFRRINAHDGVVTYADFERTVANVSGTNLSAWLGAHVGGPNRVDPPDRPTAYTAPSLASDADRDGLSDRVERTAGTHPFDVDTDDDGALDAVELAVGTDPTDAASRPFTLGPVALVGP